MYNLKVQIIICDYYKFIIYFCYFIIFFVGILFVAIIIIRYICIYFIYLLFTSVKS